LIAGEEDRPRVIARYENGRAIAATLGDLGKDSGAVRRGSTHAPVLLDD
jgi:hypothetical protein